MKRRTTEQIIKLLESKGHIVTAKKRKDSGYYITSIDTMRFTGSKGNAKAREMTGQRLSRAQLTQRKTNARNMRVKPLPKTLMKQLQKTRKAMKEKQVQAKISVKNVRKAYARLGLKGIKLQLRKQERYARGYAYVENVEWFIERLQQLGNFKQYSFDNIIFQLRKKIFDIKDKTLMQMYEWLYRCEQNAITPKELENQLNAIIDSEII